MDFREQGYIFFLPHEQKIVWERFPLGKKGALAEAKSVAPLRSPASLCFG